MVKSTARILKPAEVTLEGRFALNLGNDSPQPPAAPSKQVCEPGVTVIDKNDQFVVLEFTCSCGRRTQLKCTYTSEQNDQDTN